MLAAASVPFLIIPLIVLIKRPEDELINRSAPLFHLILLLGFTTPGATSTANEINAEAILSLSPEIALRPTPAISAVNAADLQKAAAGKAPDANNATEAELATSEKLDAPVAASPASSFPAPIAAPASSACALTFSLEA